MLSPLLKPPLLLQSSTPPEQLFEVSCTTSRVFVRETTRGPEAHCPGDDWIAAAAAASAALAAADLSPPLTVTS